MVMPAKIEINGEIYIKESSLEKKHNQLRSNVRPDAKCNLRSIMIEREINCADLAKATGITITTISNYANNVGSPNVLKAQLIANALQVSISDIWNVGIA